MNSTIKNDEAPPHISSRPKACSGPMLFVVALLLVTVVAGGIGATIAITNSNSNTPTEVPTLSPTPPTETPTTSPSFSQENIEEICEDGIFKNPGSLETFSVCVNEVTRIECFFQTLREEECPDQTCVCPFGVPVLNSCSGEEGTCFPAKRFTELVELSEKTSNSYFVCLDEQTRFKGTGGLLFKDGCPQGNPCICPLGVPVKDGCAGVERSCEEWDEGDLTSRPFTENFNGTLLAQLANFCFQKNELAESQYTVCVDDHLEFSCFSDLSPGRAEFTTRSDPSGEQPICGNIGEFLDFFDEPRQEVAREFQLFLSENEFDTEFDEKAFKTLHEGCINGDRPSICVTNQISVSCGGTPTTLYSFEFEEERC